MWRAAAQTNNQANQVNAAVLPDYGELLSLPSLREPQKSSQILLLPRSHFLQRKRLGIGLIGGALPETFLQDPQTA